MTREEIINELERLAVGGKWSTKESSQALYKACEMLDDCKCGEAD